MIDKSDIAAGNMKVSENQQIGMNIAIAQTAVIVRFSIIISPASFRFIFVESAPSAAASRKISYSDIDVFGGIVGPHLI